jgi:CRISPR-associated exonuclease Cas4
MLTIDDFTSGLASARQLTTAQTLGDRTGYIGASDIGQCPRKAILSKALPKPHDLKTLVYFARGHLVEDIVASALSGLNPARQMELGADIPYCSQCRWWASHAPVNNPAHCPSCGTPLSLLPMKAHLDFVFDADLVLECKSSDISDIWPAWETQLQTQMFLYEHCLQRTPQGILLVLDLARGALNITDPYTLDPHMVPDIVQRGITIWEGIDTATLSSNPEDLPFRTEPGPLCGCCEYLSTCPAFLGDELPDGLVTLFEQYIVLCQAEKDAKAKKDILRDQVLSLLAPGKYISGNIRASVSKRNRTSTDLGALSALLEELGQDITEFQDRTAYQVLNVMQAS